MPAYRLSFDLEFDSLFAGSPERDPQRQAEMLRTLVTTRLLNDRRKLARDQMHDVRKSDLSDDDKLAAQQDGIQTLMLTIMAEANCAIEPLPAGHEVETQLPFEKAYEVPADTL